MTSVLQHQRLKPFGHPASDYCSLNFILLTFIVCRLCSWSVRFVCPCFVNNNGSLFEVSQVCFTLLKETFLRIPND